MTDSHKSMEKKFDRFEGKADGLTKISFWSVHYSIVRSYSGLYQYLCEITSTKVIRDR